VSVSDIRVHRAGADNLDVIVPLFDAYRQFYRQPSDMTAARAFLQERLAADEAVVFVAYDGDEPAGFTLLYPSFSSVSVRRLWILNDLFVSPTARRGGVGRALLERARQLAVETNAKGLVLSTAATNAPAQKLYESAGWRRDDEFFHYYLFI
jgi:ribosomal protein S18 acetylase RimI-like enzyme